MVSHPCILPQSTRRGWGADERGFYGDRGDAGAGGADGFEGDERIGLCAHGQYVSMV